MFEPGKSRCDDDMTKTATHVNNDGKAVNEVIEQLKNANAVSREELLKLYGNEYKVTLKQAKEGK